MGDEEGKRVETKELTRELHELKIEVKLMGQEMRAHLSSHTKSGDRIWAILQPIIIALIMSYGSYQFFEFKARQMDEARKEAAVEYNSNKGRPAVRGGVPVPRYSESNTDKKKGNTALAPNVDEGGERFNTDSEASAWGL